MNLFTQEQTYDLCRKVGFTAKNAKIASAIAMCESAYSTNGRQYANFDAIGDQALSNRVWGYSYGGFQVRSLWADSGTGGIRDAQRLLDPEFNTRSARAIKLSQGWGAWSVYRTGMYKAYLQDIYPPAPGTYVVVRGDTLSGIGNRLGIAWTDLARWNNLHSPFTIFIGQILMLSDPIGA